MEIFNNITSYFTMHIVLWNHLAHFSKPQQLSTFALTLFNYKTEVDGEKVSVGMFTDIFYDYPLFTTYLCC